MVLDRPWLSLADAERQQLDKIASALKQRIDPRFGLEGFRIVDQQPVEPQAWQNIGRRAVYFGEPLAQATLYEVLALGNCTAVFSEPLAQLAHNEAAKQKLWKALQQMFARD